MDSTWLDQFRASPAWHFESKKCHAMPEKKVYNSLPPSTYRNQQHSQKLYMSAATAPIGSIADFSIYQKLNSVWHRRALNLFMFHSAGPLGRASGPGLSDLRVALAAAKGGMFSWFVFSLARELRTPCTTVMRS